MMAAGVQHLGLFLCALALTGSIFALRRPGARRLLAAALWLTWAVLFIRFSSVSSEPSVLRFYFFILGMGILLGVDFLASSRWPRPLKALFLAAIFMETGWRGFVVLENSRLSAGESSTRALAAAWMADHVPAGAGVGLVRYPEPAHAPPFRFDRYRLVFFDAPQSLPPGREPDYLVVDKMGRVLVEKCAQNKYEAVRDFLPWQALWAGPAENSFINNAMHVYKLRPARGPIISPVNNQGPTVKMQLRKAV